MCYENKAWLIWYLNIYLSWPQQLVSSLIKTEWCSQQMWCCDAASEMLCQFKVIVYFSRRHNFAGSAFGIFIFFPFSIAGLQSLSVPVFLEKVQQSSCLNNWKCLRIGHMFPMKSSRYTTNVGMWLKVHGIIYNMSLPDCKAVQSARPLDYYINSCAYKTKDGDTKGNTFHVSKVIKCAT